MTKHPYEYRTGSPLNRLWKALRNMSYRYQITMCEDWEEYPAFGAWAVINGFDDYRYPWVERIDSKAGFAPDNCRIVEKWDYRAQRYREKREKQEEHKAAVLAQRRQDGERLETDVWENLAKEYLASRSAVTLSAILEAIGIKPERQTQREVKRIARIIRKLGWTRDTGRTWVRK